MLLSHENKLIASHAPGNHTPVFLDIATIIAKTVTYIQCPKRILAVSGFPGKNSVSETGKFRKIVKLIKANPVFPI